MVDVDADTVRPGSTWSIDGQWRFLQRVELEAHAAWTDLRERGRHALFDGADSVVLIYHFDAQSALRTIVRRTRVVRTAIVSGDLPSQAQTSLDVSLTYSDRLSGSSIFYLGAAAHRATILCWDASARQVFAKWQFAV